MKDNSDPLINTVAATFVLGMIVFVVFLLTHTEDKPVPRTVQQEPTKERRVTKIVRWLWTKE